MKATRPRLTPALEAQICAYVRAGGFPHVAAGAAGVPHAVFAEWLRRGRLRKAPGRYRTFAAAVEQAAAQARLRAETDTFTGHPRDWLKYGPGRDTAQAPGWAAAVKPAPRQGAPNALLRAEVLGLVGDLLAALAPFPEARAAAARALTAAALLEVS